MTDEQNVLKTLKKIRQNLYEDTLFIDNINKYLNSELKNSDVIKIGKTPIVMQAIGADNLDFIITQGTLKNSMNPENKKIHGHTKGHNISIKIIKMLPNYLRNPTMILSGSKKNSIVLITDIKDKENRNVIIPITLNKQFGFYYVNSIDSIYGKNNIKNYIEKAFKNNTVLAVNKEKTDKMLHSIGCQSSKENTFISYDDSIAYSMKSVNIYNQKNKERVDVMENDEKLIENLNFDDEINISESFKEAPQKSEAYFTMLKEYEQAQKSNDEYVLNWQELFEHPQKYANEVIEYDVKNVPEDINILTQLSENGDLQASNMLAVAYFFGNNIDQDIDKAVELFSLAADGGLTSAQRNLAIILESNEPKDPEKAVEYYKKAAINKNPDAYALNNLGACFLVGEGCKRNPEKAVNLFAKAAKLGDDYAMLNLADCLSIGLGTKANPKRAFSIYSEAAKAGNVTALRRMAECCLNGKGTRTDPERALQYLKTACEKGDKQSLLLYTELEQKLNPVVHKEVFAENKDNLNQNLNKTKEKFTENKDSLKQKLNKAKEKMNEKNKNSERKAPTKEIEH